MERQTSLTDSLPEDAAKDTDRLLDGDPQKGAYSTTSDSTTTDGYFNRLSRIEQNMELLTIQLQNI